MIQITSHISWMIRRIGSSRSFWTIQIQCQTMSPRNSRTYAHKYSPIWLFKHKLNKDNSNRYVSIAGETLPRPQLYINNYNLGILRPGEIVFYREEHTNWLANTKWLALKTYMQWTLCRLYICIYIQLLIKNKPWIPSEQEQLVYWTLWRRKGNDVNTL